MRMTFRRQRGMTLLEILVALAITGVVIGLGCGMLSSTERLLAQQQDSAMIDTAGWIWTANIAKDLRSSIALPSVAPDAGWSGTSGKVAFTEGLKVLTSRVAPEFTNMDLSTDTMRIPVAGVRVSSGQEGAGYVEYSLARGKNGDISGLARKTWLRDETAPAAEPGLVSPRIVSLAFAYRSADGAWQPTWNTPATAPKAVRVTLGAIVRKGKMAYPRYFSTIIALPSGTRITQ